MHKWSLAPSPNCKCDAIEHTADHVLIAGSIHRAHGARGHMVLDNETRCRLITPSLPASDLGRTVAWGSERINPRPRPVCDRPRVDALLNNDDNKFI